MATAIAHHTKCGGQWWDGGSSWKRTIKDLKRNLALLINKPMCDPAYWLSADPVSNLFRARIKCSTENARNTAALEQLEFINQLATPVILATPADLAMCDLPDEMSCIVPVNIHEKAE